MSSSPHEWGHRENPVTKAKALFDLVDLTILSLVAFAGLSVYSLSPLFCRVIETAIHMTEILSERFYGIVG